MRLPDDDGSDFALPHYTLLFYSTQTHYGVTNVILTTVPLRTNTSSVSCNALPVLVPFSFHPGSTERASYRVQDATHGAVRVQPSAGRLEACFL